MGYRLNKIYTRTGDDGTTSVEPHHRLLKNHARIEALGALDELNSVIGMLLACEIKTLSLPTRLQQIQHDLLNMGGELCPPHHIVITAEKISELEQWLDEWNENLPPLTEFILPGGNQAAAICHFARTVCRRAERCLVTLHLQETVQPNLLRYINRLSDLLFVAARVLARETTDSEILWDHQRQQK